ncbi:TniB family NTP-binding protein [Arthrobacter sp. MW3 TE3886]|uniref:TniB family NTP-binding protein n=1 Tax=Arthrobacter sp. MW3 TE3886 TaxID=3156254 RepID=UPI003516DCEF
MIFTEIDAVRLDRHEDLNLLLAAKPAKPELPSFEQYAALTRQQRQDLDALRLDYLAGGLTASTPQVKALIRNVRLAVLGNRGRASGRTGVMVSGQSTVGKTTACIAVMRGLRAMYSHQYPGFEGRGEIPVAYVEVPSGSSAKAMIGRFAHFYGLELPKSCTLEEILHAVVTAMRTCSTQLVVVDELQNLSRVSQGNGESVDVLKSLSNQVPSTFVYSGINIHRGGLLTGERGNQISRRFTLLEMHRYGNATKEEVKAWKGIVMAFSEQLPLLAHEPKSLLKTAAWLHKRSGGNIGTLQRILVGGSQLRILDGDPAQETLTREYMEAIPIDMAAETKRGQLDDSPALRQLAG